LKPKHQRQALAAAALLAVAAVYAIGAQRIPGEAGYGGVGPNFLPWLVCGALTLLGMLLGWQAISGGWQGMPDTVAAPDDDEPDPFAHERPRPIGPDWPAFAWVSAGLLLNAGLISSVGFVMSCALCFALASQGVRVASGAGFRRLQVLGRDLALGICIAAPVFWLFTLALGVSLPSLTGTPYL
jgi:putative tricarboxylic transport membrane protein